MIKCGQYFVKITLTNLYQELKRLGWLYSLGSERGHDCWVGWAGGKEKIL